MVGISGRGTCSNFFFFCYFGARAPAGRTRTGLASRWEGRATWAERFPVIC